MRALNQRSPRSPSIRDIVPERRATYLHAPQRACEHVCRCGVASCFSNLGQAVANDYAGRHPLSELNGPVILKDSAGALCTFDVRFLTILLILLGKI